LTQTGLTGRAAAFSVARRAHALFFTLLENSLALNVSDSRRRWSFLRSLLVKIAKSSQVAENSS